MAGLDDLDALQRLAVTGLGGDRAAGDPVAQQFLERERHAGRRLAGADDDDPPDGVQVDLAVPPGDPQRPAADRHARADQPVRTHRVQAGAVDALQNVSHRPSRSIHARNASTVLGKASSSHGMAAGSVQTASSHSSPAVRVPPVTVAV